jgi:hypothetical protein
MAINVNTVYQTVLLILNKEQRGYMTPVEFNKTGAQAQLEIFETYFDSLNQQIRVPQTNTDYADRVVNLDEKISIFKEFGNATSISSSNVFNLPQQFSGTTATLSMVTAPTITTVATLDYTIGNNAGGNTVTASDISNGVTQVFANGVLLDESEYTISGKIISFNTQPVIGLGLFVNVYPKQFYRLGNLFYTNNAIPTQELERVGRGDLFHLLSSSLTKPSTTYPIYVYEKNQITVYPTSIVNGINVSYIRKPLPPVWNFSVGGNNQYVYSPSSSFDFELHPADQTELILKILLYAGVVIQSPEIIQVAASQVQQEQTNQKS